MSKHPFLNDMKLSDGTFLLASRQVCSTFLLKKLCFSRDVQAAVRSHMLFPESMKDIKEQSILPTSIISPDKAAPERDAIVSFLERLADDTGVKMPDNPERHLQLFRKREVYEQFFKEYALLNEGTPPTKVVLCKHLKNFLPQHQGLED